MNLSRQSQQSPKILLALCLAAIPIGLSLFLPEPPPAYANSIVVTSLADTISTCASTGVGTCTLRDAITFANSNAGSDAVTFSVTGTIVLGSVLPTVSSSSGLSIDGGNLITVSGNDAFQVFAVGSSAHLSLQNLAIRNGKAAGSSGGGIFNSGVLTITSSNIFSNTATWGAGIANSSGALYITNTNIYGNAGSLGGAIYNIGPFTATNSNIYSNSATTGAGIIAVGGVGVLSNVHVYNNGASGYGGGIDNHASNSVLTVTNSTIFSNTAYYGGGISNEWGTLYLSDSNLSGNSADGGAGIYNSTGVTLTISNVMISTNTANGSGGGIHSGGALNITNTTFYSNAASSTGSGGGIYISGGSPVLNNITFTMNSAQSGAGLRNGASLTLTNSTFNGNIASTYGGAIRNGGTLWITNTTIYSNAALSGGGIFNQGTLTVTNGTLSSNSDGIYNFSGSSTLRNTIIASGTSGGNCSGAITNGSNNLDSGATCGWDSTNGSMSNTDPKLAPLANYSGPTRTMPLLIGSLAIDGVTWNAPNGCPLTDQRGTLRPIGPRCDIGAVEGTFYPLYLPLIAR